VLSIVCLLLLFFIPIDFRINSVLNWKLLVTFGIAPIIFYIIFLVKLINSIENKDISFEATGISNYWKIPIIVSVFISIIFYLI